MNAYADYMESKIKWAQKIPSNWSSVRIKHVSECLDGKRIPLNAEQRGELPGDYPYWGANGVVDTVGDYLFDEPLVLVGEDGAPFFDKAKDVAFNVDGKIWVNNHAHILRAKNIEGRFLKYALNSTSYELYIKGSTRDKLTQFELNNIEIPYPTLDEQTFISNFLDRECGRISAIIREKQNFVDLLNEKRQALISHFVTKGLDANVPMKDSGVEWIGKVPEHWIVSSFKYVTKVLTDYTANGSFADLKKNIVYKDTPAYARLVRLTDLRKNLENLNGVWIDKDAYDYLSKSALFGGEFLLANVGAHAGLFYQMPRDKGAASLAPNMFMARFDEKIVSEEYMAAVGQSDGVHKQLRLLATSSAAQPKLNKDDFRSVRFAYPSLAEQSQIALKLSSETKIYDQLIAEVMSSITLLTEQRIALISAAVTGKIDVRNYNKTEAV